ncbi:Pectinesterase [Bertholletia excelsa]
MEGKHKRTATIVVSSLLLVAMVIAVTVGVTKNSESDKGVSTSTKSIQALCESTDYKTTCVESLSESAGNTTDPKELINSGCDEEFKTLEEAQKDERVKQVLMDCRGMAEEAIADLKRSMNQMGEINAGNFNEVLADLKIWLSGAITYQETCLDGFENTTGDAAMKMREILKKSMEMTSNGLAMITDISTQLEALHLFEGNQSRRRLLSLDRIRAVRRGWLPSWVSETARKLIGENPEMIKADLVVAKDGSGKYRTIREALNEVPQKSNTTFVLYIKEGVYEERVIFDKGLTNLVVIGDGPTKTKITGGLNYIDGTNTYHTASVVVQADNFIAKNIGFENSAGPEKHQAVALRVSADKVIFHNCQMDGYQDTLYAHTYRQYYRDCVISGTIDFIFGDSAAVFQNCVMLVRKPLDNQQNIVTAQGRKELRQPTGIVLQNCTIASDPEYFPVRHQIKSYLGRPWKNHSRTIIMESQIDDLIQPEGWLPWEGDFGLDTCYYAEYNNRGPASSKEHRVQWKGVKELTRTRVERFTAAQFLEGDTWIPASGVPYVPGLMFPPPADSPRAMEMEDDLEKLDKKATNDNDDEEGEDKKSKDDHDKDKKSEDSDHKHKSITTSHFVNHHHFSSDPVQI